MAQWVRSLLCKHEGLSVNPQGISVIQGLYGTMGKSQDAHGPASLTLYSVNNKETPLPINEVKGKD